MVVYTKNLSIHPAMYNVAILSINFIIRHESVSTEDSKIIWKKFKHDAQLNSRKFGAPLLPSVAHQLL